VRYARAESPALEPEEERGTAFRGSGVPCGGSPLIPGSLREEASAPSRDPVLPVLLFAVQQYLAVSVASAFIAVPTSGTLQAAKRAAGREA